ncbi:MAG: CofH family radical SAM protein, partial [Acidobacteriota bacterium]
MANSVAVMLTLAGVLEKAIRFEPLTPQEARQLLEVTDPVARQDIFATAHACKQALVGPRATYVVNLNLNFTNVCALHCTFCAFRREADARDAYARTIEAAVEQVARYRRDYGITEVTIQGGLNPALPVSYYFDLLRALKQACPEVHLHAYSPQEIDFIAQRSGWSLGQIFDTLRTAGQGTLCGTAAEILVEPTRRKICPEKITGERWLEIVRAAHQAGTRTTSTMLFGHIESLDDRVAHLDALRRLQRETGGLTEFIPLPFIAAKSPLGRAVGRREISDEEVLLVVAVARLFWGTELLHLQLGWVKRGLVLGQRSLLCGADDLGGTLLEEEISNRAGSRFGSYVPTERLAATIAALGLEPVQRTTTYDRAVPGAAAGALGVHGSAKSEPPESHGAAHTFDILSSLKAGEDVN